MDEHVAQDLAFRERVRESFSRQEAMALIGARLTVVEPGRVSITIPFRQDLTQQHGYLHAGIVTAIADSACGYAALSLMSAGSEVLTVEFKVNLVCPASGARFEARGEVVKSGRTLSVSRADVYSVTEGKETLVAVMQATMIAR